MESDAVGRGFISLGRAGALHMTPPSPPTFTAHGGVNEIVGATVSLQGRLAFDKQYESWSAAGGLARTVGAFVEGAANFVASLGIPLKIAIALMGVMVASFAGTTMDTACRLQRYVVQELARTFLPRAAGACVRDVWV